MKRKTKRYDGEDGSLVEDESERGSMTADQQANSDATNAAAKTAEPQSFKQAFASARSGGDKTFTWQGKSYTTELASSKPTPKAEAPAPKTETKATPKAEAPTPKAETKTEIKKTSTNPNVPTPEEADANRKAAVENIGKVASGIGSYLKETFTPSGRMAVEKRRREANKAIPGAKKGGMASSRGDGIAQRGHTKGRYM
jgi:hypothetical protein